LKRNKNKIYEHLWQGVAGKIEEGETPPEAAIRELKEETGLDPVNMFVADHVSRFYEVHGDRVNIVPVFGIEAGSTEVTLSDEHIDFKWVNIKDALNTLVWNGQKEGIQTVYDMVKNNDGRMRWSKVNL
jgi:8-oxo-dGTP pyrophosphatase MutT (NUDIX family)